jgi:hypothetical protein
LISEHLDLSTIEKITLPSGESFTKRIAFLAEVRNRALRPLETLVTKFDRLLFINDVIFDPIEAVQLLFSTHTDPTTGLADYGAACAVDFINPFKFYDRYATRDFEGYESGIPFYPWFTDVSEAVSRKDVLAQSDAVRVRSCWGGMTAFEAKWFQERKPLRFRFEKELFWEASECCLIHADLTHSRHGADATRSGIYMNPFVRVAYDAGTLGWLPYTKRVERLYSFIHTILNHLVGIPTKNPRQFHAAGMEATENVWQYDQDVEKSQGPLTGSYHKETRTVEAGRMCGYRGAMVLRDKRKKGEKSWMKVPAPGKPD